MGLIESWKLCLNLCSGKRFRPSWTPVIYWITIGLLDPNIIVAIIERIRRDSYEF